MAVKMYIGLFFISGLMWSCLEYPRILWLDNNSLGLIGIRHQI